MDNDFLNFRRKKALFLARNKADKKTVIGNTNKIVKYVIGLYKSKGNVQMNKYAMQPKNA
jgi:hypothetical protein